ncbi:glycosyltransferase 87 family protein [Planotetraspora sp. A-T 1434]|uniref:glycosyltransferase 87 family protein n=1 Tax=Planotetraspora sp. A-T 1434 TaxID=2979219 RepID=UPI0021C0652F|nr:glycosyltransferase 87 family protein [Planotetraspora sp. A-T 1434]MCT9931737.1 glycosyltransferase 87 family protein [Planotetraspora sp. A-T 1434]
MTTGQTTAVKRPAWMWSLSLLIVVVAAAPLIAYWLTNPDDQRLVDLDVYRMGGSALRLGLPVYGVITPAPQLLPFTYPPVAAMLATPLAVLSWPAAQWVWTIGIVVALAVTVWYGFRPLLERLTVPIAAPLVFGLLTAACLYLMPIRDQVRFGQVDLFLVALCLTDLVARRPRWPRGVLVGLATAVKLTPGVFLISLAITGFPSRDGFGPKRRDGGRLERRDDDLPERRGGDRLERRDRGLRQRRVFFMAAFVAALLTILPFLVIFHDARDYWFKALLDSERLGANAATTNQSLRGMLLRLYLPGWLTSVIWLAAVAVIGWYGFRAARRAFLDGDTMTGVALTGLMAVLLSPVAWIHHLAWLVIVLAALAGSGKDRVRLLVAGGVWLYYVLPIPWWGVSIKALDIPVISPVIGKVVQDAFGLGAVALVWVLASWLPRRRTMDRLSSPVPSAVS